MIGMDENYDAWPGLCVVLVTCGFHTFPVVHQKLTISSCIELCFRLSISLRACEPDQGSPTSRNIKTLVHVRSGTFTGVMAVRGNCPRDAWPADGQLTR